MTHRIATALTETDTWPKHPNGENKRVGDMTPDERRTVCVASNARVMGGVQVLFAKQDVTITRSGCVHRGHESRIAVENNRIIYRNGWSDPAVIRESELASFTAMLTTRPA